MNKINEVLSIFLNVTSAIIFLNTSIITIEMYISYAAIITSMLVLLLYANFLSKKQKRVVQDIYPEIQEESIYKPIIGIADISISE